MNVEIHDHPDGGGLIVVTVNGFIRWRGRDREAAHIIARSLGAKSEEAGQARRTVADEAMPRAIDVMRRAL
jgi:hypothetical protein